MGEIDRVLRQAARRLWANDLLAILSVCLAVAVAAAAVVRLAQKLMPFGLPWGWALLGALAAASAAAVVITMVRARPRDAVARELDERADLRETLSTALAVRADGSPWSRAVVESAGERARRVLVRDAVPIGSPRRWWWPLAAAGALAAVWWLPSWDVAGLFTQNQARAEEQAELVRVKDEIRQDRDALAELAAKAGIELDEGALEGLEGDLTPEAPLTPDAVRRAAIRELTSLSEQLEAQQNSEQAAQLGAMKESFRRLRNPGPGPMSEMSRQLARGEFDKAQDALEQLAEALASGEMSEEQKSRAAEQLESLKEQVEALAQQRDDLEEQLRSAGLSQEQAEQAAQSPEALQRALEQNQNLSEEQKQQLQQSAQSQQNASDALSSLASSMGQMAQGMQNPGGEQMQDALGAMSSQLGQMEAMSQELASAQAALAEAQRQMQKLGGECSGGSCESLGQGGSTFREGWGQWQPGDSSMSQGSGSGRAGQGNGAGPPEEAADFAIDRRKAAVQTTEGPVIAQTLVYGSQVRGESRQAFRSAASAARAEAAEAIETKLVPKRYESAAQHYFGRLESVAGSGSAEPQAEGSEP